MGFLKFNMGKFFMRSIIFAVLLICALEKAQASQLNTLKDVEASCKNPHRGPPGPQGPSGSPGPQGPVGPTGATGATGGVIGDNFIYSYQDGQQFLTSALYTALTIPAANTPVDNGWTRPNDTDFLCHQTGTYLVIYRVVVFNISGSVDVSVAVKAENNGTEIIGSQVSANLNRAPQISNSAVLTTSFLINATSGDILNFWGVTSASPPNIISVQGVSAGGSDDPTGISVTITRVQ